MLAVQFLPAAKRTYSRTLGLMGAIVAGVLLGASLAEWWRPRLPWLIIGLVLLAVGQGLWRHRRTRRRVSTPPVSSPRRSAPLPLERPANPFFDFLLSAPELP